MATFDYVVLGIVAISLVIGLWRGVVSELIALAAWVLAFMAALEFGAASGQAVFAGIVDPALRALAGCVLVFVGVLVAMSLVRLAVRSMVKALGLSLSDRLLGMFFGLARGILLVMLLVAAGGMTSAPQQPWWKDATLAPPLETAVLVAKPWLPDDLAKKIRFS
ncbi:CvpA family protein [Dechloromonas sp. H13]|uniref:CvpA family protein n=1 Tax=Dechloromonas sp. H13 TaxID=2570193 RepID=UPI00129152C5|nr:CvpA family protein [Dechloromonas sp. H13]